MAKNPAAREPRLSPLDRLYTRPGFMIRRAHQISTNLFIEACAELDITPSQYGVLYILLHEGPLEQVGIARLIGLDRSTTALVVKILAERGWLDKTKSVTDQRKVEISLTETGRQALRQCERYAKNSVTTLLAPFDEAEREQFLGLLDKFVSHFNEHTRVTLG
ncbi:MarR family transcriptional regulator [Paraburkholderia bonniea]|uniref:MarR family winged helix-turn-helix transcriptional regulator n=1 Tax=Paraburkholderia bonniea TaxID=2152891 RepID=UPI0025722437|nr:MarR family transcriptional regulator [Paraburkholderia bonniea]WJF91934.1 MarR family transcriptional regulator [Paraburkholderia bonniea]WJF95253.1 MarR family transcriptional regulator [Paraburkholderia bonniea]